MLQFGPGAFAAAFAAGLLSFVSRRVLRLIPGYLSFASGVGFDELGHRPRLVVGQTAWFVSGFGIMFALLGAGAAWFGNALLVHRRLLEITAGGSIALAGIVYAGLRLPTLLVAERRIHLGRRAQGPLTALLAGVAFAIGWTPCIGPTLAAIFTLAAADGHVAQPPSCSPSTHSDWASPSCSSGSPLPAPSTSPTASAATGERSASPPAPCSSASASCSPAENSSASLASSPASPGSRSELKAPLSRTHTPARHTGGPIARELPLSLSLGHTRAANHHQQIAAFTFSG